MKEPPGFPRKTSHRLQAAADIGFLASLLALASAIETVGSPEDQSQTQRLAAEVRDMARRGTETDHPERIL